VIRGCGILQLNRFEPWILARRLIEVAVETNEFFHTGVNTPSEPGYCLERRG